MTVSADFPSAIWDGLSGNRDRFDDVIDPNSEDFDQMRAEMIALQNHLISVLDASKNGLLNALVIKGTDPSYTTIADLFKFTTKDIIVAVGSSAVASKTTGYTIPVASLVFAAALNVESAITLVTATKIGVGPAGDLDKYGKVTTGAKNVKSTLSMTPMAIASTEALSVYAVDNNGDAAGTIQNGSIRIRLLIATQSDLPDAA